MPRRSGFALLALSIALLAPGVSAQLPAAPACATLTLVNAGPAPFEPGESAEVVETVSVGPPPNSPAPSAPDVVVTLTVDASAAPGWKITPESTQVTATATRPGQARFTLTAPAERPADAGEVSFTVTATGSCAAGGQSGPFAAAGATDVISAELVPPAGISIPGLGVVPLPYLLGGVAVVAIVAGALLVIGRGAGGFRIRAPETTKDIQPGRGTSFAIEVENRGSEPDTAQFVVEGVPSGWSAFTAVPDVQLAAKEARTVWVMVRAPEDAQPGVGVPLDVEVRSAASGKSGGRVQIVATVAASA